MRKRAARLIMLTISVALVAAACGGSASSDVTKVRDPASVSAGETMYNSTCAACHGAALEGGTTPGGVVAPALLDKLRQSDADLVRIAREGKGTDMPAFASQVSEADMQLIVDYIRATQAANQ